MKRSLQLFAMIAIVVGVCTEMYSWQEQNIVNVQAESAARVVAPNKSSFAWASPQIPMEERALGVAVGFGFAFLGAVLLNRSSLETKPLE